MPGPEYCKAAQFGFVCCSRPLGHKGKCKLDHIIPVHFDDFLLFQVLAERMKVAKNLNE